MRICSNKKMIDQSSQTHDKTGETSVRHEYCQRCFVIITADGKSDASTQTCPERFQYEADYAIGRSLAAACEQEDVDSVDNIDADQEIPTWSSLSDS